MPPNRFVFVIRLWQEDGRNPKRPSTLRGSVQMAHEEKALYFHSLEQIPELLRRLTGWEEDMVAADDE